MAESPLQALASHSHPGRLGPKWHDPHESQPHSCRCFRQPPHHPQLPLLCFPQAASDVSTPRHGPLGPQPLALLLQAQDLRPPCGLCPHPPAITGGPSPSRPCPQGQAETRQQQGSALGTSLTSPGTHACRQHRARPREPCGSPHTSGRSCPLDTSAPGAKASRCQRRHESAGPSQGRSQTTWLQPVSRPGC